MRFSGAGSQIILIRGSYISLLLLLLWTCNKKLVSWDTVCTKLKTSTQGHRSSDSCPSGTLTGESAWVSKSTGEKNGWLGTWELFVNNSGPLTSLRLFLAVPSLLQLVSLCIWPCLVSPSWSTRMKSHVEPWSGWLSWLGTVLQTKRSRVRFLLRAHAWVAGSVLCPHGAPADDRRQPLTFLPHIDVPLPLCLPPFPLSKMK